MQVILTTSFPTNLQKPNTLNSKFMLKCEKKLLCQFITQLDTCSLTAAAAKAWSYAVLRSGMGKGHFDSTVVIHARGGTQKNAKRSSKYLPAALTI